jgi:hypothetical protein
MKKYIISENQLKKVIDKLITEEKQINEIKNKRRIKKTKK